MSGGRRYTQVYPSKDMLVRYVVSQTVNITFEK